MLAKYRHPNIVLMIAAITTPPQLCLIMELVKEGTLYDLIHKRKVNLTDQDKRRITIQIISVINYLHKHGIVHRDIKSHNFLVDKNYNIKICDFGLARHKVHHIKLSHSSIVGQCSSVEHQLIWLSNSSSKELTIKLLIFLH
jgi:sterile alpha motif and leucine zipper containing kinase AZK